MGEVTGVSGWKKAIVEPLQNAQKNAMDSKPLDLTNLTHLTFEQRIPKEALHDGNLCTFMNSKFTNPLHLCDGFDVSGMDRNRACPHAPGACLVNEEFNLGRCFKKCAILTNNTFPFRSAASTCCRYNSHLACLDPVNVQSSASFNIGGGGGDGHASTPAESHEPLLALTED